MESSRPAGNTQGPLPPLSVTSLKPIPRPTTAETKSNAAAQRRFASNRASEGTASAPLLATTLATTEGLRSDLREVTEKLAALTQLVQERLSISPSTSNSTGRETSRDLSPPSEFGTDRSTSYSLQSTTPIGGSPRPDTARAMPTTTPRRLEALARTPELPPEPTIEPRVKKSVSFAPLDTPRSATLRRAPLASGLPAPTHALPLAPESASTTVAASTAESAAPVQNKWDPHFDPEIYTQVLSITTKGTDSATTDHLMHKVLDNILLMMNKKIVITPELAKLSDQALTHLEAIYNYRFAAKCLRLRGLEKSIKPKLARTMNEMRRPEIKTLRLEPPQKTIRYAQAFASKLDDFLSSKEPISSPDEAHDLLAHITMFKLKIQSDLKQELAVSRQTPEPHYKPGPDGHPTSLEGPPGLS